MRIIHTSPTELLVAPLYVPVCIPLLPGFFLSALALHLCFHLPLCLSIYYTSTTLHYLNSLNALFSQMLLFHTEFQFQCERVQERASKISQQTKALATEPDNVNSIHMVEEKLTLANFLLIFTHTCTYIHRHTRTIYKREFKRT